MNATDSAGTARPPLAEQPRASRMSGFASLDEEVHLHDLPVTGELPGWLTGSAIRVTPALLDVGGTPVGHWFDGLGMLNVFSLAGGRVSYSSRFLDTAAYRRARQGRRDLGISMNTDPCRHLGQRLAALFVREQVAANPAVNVIKLGERFLASTESPVPVEFDPRTLHTTGYLDLRRDVREGHGDFAHPHLDKHTGHLVSYITRYSRRSTHQVISVDPHSLRRRTLATIPIDGQPEYMHSFGMSENYVVLVRQPLTYSLPTILRTGKFQDGYRWHPERGTLFTVVQRHTGRVVNTCLGESLFFWHQVNAFENDGEIVLDLVASDDPTAVWDLDLVKLRNPAHRPAFHGELRRYWIPLGGGPVRTERLCDSRIEFPHINYARAGGRDYRYAYAIGYRSTTSDWFDELLKIDVHSGSARRWSEEGCYPSEPMFAASPTSENEDDGVILTIVLDARVNKSFLLVLDATELTEIARATVPHHIPFNFHQQYFR